MLLVGETATGLAGEALKEDLAINGGVTGAGLGDWETGCGMAARGSRNPWNRKGNRV